MAGHGSTAAIGNQLQVAGVGQGQQLADLLGGFRIGHGVRVDAEVALAHRQPVRQALPAGMQQTLTGVDAVARIGLQARRRDLRQRRLQAGVRQACALPDQFRQEPTGAVRQFDHGAFFAPAIPTTHEPLPSLVAATCLSEPFWLPILASRPRLSLSDRDTPVTDQDSWHARRTACSTRHDKNNDHADPGSTSVPALLKYLRHAERLGLDIAPALAAAGLQADQAQRQSPAPAGRSPRAPARLFLRAFR